MSQCIIALVWLLVGVQCHPFAGTTATSSLDSIQSENAIPRPWLWIGSLSTSTADIGPLPPTPAPAKENGLLEHYMGFFQKRANTDIISSYISETSSLSLPTSCIPSSLLDSCPASCSSNADIAKCTDFTAPYCSSSPYTSSSGTTITVMTGWGCAPTPFTETTTSSSQSTPTPATTSGSSTVATPPSTSQGIPTASPTSTATGKGFPTDFSLGGKIGCAIGASVVVALFLWWRWPKRFRCSRKRAARAETAITPAGKQGVSEKQAAPATAVQEKPIPLAEIRSRNPDAARKASFAARSIQTR